MNLDVHSLETFSNLASEGANRAADSLTTLTGIDTWVEVSEINLLSAEVAGETLEQRPHAGVAIGLAGALDGTALLTFDRESADAVVDRLGIGSTPTASLTEVGNIMIGGFVDGWANHFQTTIAITPPRFIQSVSAADVKPEGESESIVFRSTIGSDPEPIDFNIHLLSSASALSQLMGNDVSSVGIPLEKLGVFDKMTRHGAAKAAENVTAMTGIQTTVEVSRISFLPIADIPSRVDDVTTVGVMLAFDGPPSGYLAILFDEPSAAVVAEALMPGVGEDLEGMGGAAIKEVGNVMTSGFIDGWANVLGRHISHSPPELLHDLAPAVLSSVVSELSKRQEHAFLLDAAIRTPEGDIGCDIYALPDEQELAEALLELDVSRLSKEAANAAEHF